MTDKDAGKDCYISCLSNGQMRYRVVKCADTNLILDPSNMKTKFSSIEKACSPNGLMNEYTGFARDCESNIPPFVCPTQNHVEYFTDQEQANRDKAQNMLYTFVIIFLIFAIIVLNVFRVKVLDR